MDDIPVPLPARPERFMDRFKAHMRAKHLAYRTEKTYCLWVLDFIRFHHRRHPEQMGAEEVDAWLSYLANERQVAINTQKTALNAVVYLYRQFLGRDLGDMQFSKTSRGRRLPVVFSHAEAMQVIDSMNGVAGVHGREYHNDLYACVRCPLSRCHEPARWLSGFVFWHATAPPVRQFIRRV